MNNLHIVARYNEDLNWINELKGSFLIYNKSESFPFLFPHKQSENIGRETETFVRAIIENYKNLKNFDNVIFLQGNPLSHCKNIIENLNKKDFSSLYSGLNKENFYYLTDDLVLYHYPSDRQINGFHHSIIAKLYNQEYDWNVFLSDKENKINHSVYIENAMILCNILGIKCLGEFYYWAHGAQYIVPSEMILNKSLDWWKEFHKLIILTYKDFNLECLGYAAEAIWPLIWKHST
jgi:hypothetical protein